MAKINRNQIDGSVWDSVFTTVNTTSAIWSGATSTLLSSSAFWQSVFSTVQSYSGDWQSAFSTVLANSGDWFGGGSDVSTISANWQNTWATVAQNSAFWQVVYTVVATNSSDWANHSDVTLGNSSYSTVNTNSAIWSGTYTTVFSTSALWRSVYSTVLATSSNWHSTYATLFANSGSWITPALTGHSLLDHSDVYAPSVQSGYALIYDGLGEFWVAKEIALDTDVGGVLPLDHGGTGQTTTTAAFGDLSPTTTQGDLIVRGPSTNIRFPIGPQGSTLYVDYSGTAGRIRWGTSPFTVVNSGSASWNSTWATVRAGSANWTNVWTTTRASSGSWSSVYTTTRANSAVWGSTWGTVWSSSANWQGAWATVYANSALWQFVPVSETSANHTIVDDDAGTTFFVNTSGTSVFVLDTGVSLGAPITIYQTQSNSVEISGSATLLIPDGYYARTRGLNTALQIVPTTSTDVYSILGALEPIQDNTLLWDSVYSTVLQTSSTWVGTYSIVSSNSGDWHSTFATVNANSASWGAGGDTTLGDSAYATVNANSGSWGSGGDTTLGDSAYSTVNANSGDWNSSYTTINAASATWSIVPIKISIENGSGLSVGDQVAAWDGLPYTASVSSVAVATYNAVGQLLTASEITVGVWADARTADTLPTSANSIGTIGLTGTSTNRTVSPGWSDILANYSLVASVISVSGTVYKTVVELIVQV